MSSIAKSPKAGANSYDSTKIISMSRSPLHCYDEAAVLALRCLKCECSSSAFRDYVSWARRLCLGPSESSGCRMYHHFRNYRVVVGHSGEVYILGFHLAWLSVVERVTNNIKTWPIAHSWLIDSKAILRLYPLLSPSSAERISAP